MLLAFPIGLVWALTSIAIGFVLNSLGFDPGQHSLISAIEIAQVVVVIFLGYLQWFVVVPWLWRKWKARRGKDLDLTPAVNAEPKLP